jgi:hypothetical protein
MMMLTLWRYPKAILHSDCENPIKATKAQPERLGFLLPCTESCY